MKNKGTWIIVGIVAAFVLLIAGIFVSTNNRAVSLEEQVFTADSDIQAQEKRRTDLIYNLADCVKEYDKHEAETLLNVSAILIISGWRIRDVYCRSGP